VFCQNSLQLSPLTPIYCYPLSLIFHVDPDWIPSRRLNCRLVIVTPLHIWSCGCGASLEDDYGDSDKKESFSQKIGFIGGWADRRQLCRTRAARAVRCSVREPDRHQAAPQGSGQKRRRNNKRELMNDNVMRVPARSLKEQFSRGSEAWKEQADTIFRFSTQGDWWGFPFYSLSASQIFRRSKDALPLLAARHRRHHRSEGAGFLRWGFVPTA